MGGIASLVETLSAFKPGAPLEKFIGKIRFPNFKNIEPGTEVDFTFPLTVLVGANGSGKSSILHALYGAPEKQTTRDFWFSTELDPIVEGKGLGPSRYIYSHWNSQRKQFVETRKARVKSGQKLDYWEPTKIVVGDEMEPLPADAGEGAASDRWLPVDRDVVYINSRAEISAFDRYFLYETGQTKERKHENMLLEARRLKNVIEGNRQSCVLYNRERVFENRQLSSKELTWIKEILGYNYDAAVIVRHTLYPGYRGQDISVLFKRPSLTYSEAFAGSGEVSIVSSVVKLLAAQPSSLVLLDEPETSLHPGAQRKFLEFLLFCIKEKKIQIVLSTHSPEFVHGLPDNAIKVLTQNPNGRVTVGNTSSSLVAFKRLGAIAPEKIRVIVEDPLGKEVVRIAIRQLPEGERDHFDIVVVPGGAEMILSHYIPAAIASNDSTYVLLDGDKKFQPKLPDLSELSPSQEPGLEKMILEATGVVPKLYLSGGNDPNVEAHRIAALKKYVNWATERVRFLPGECPEAIVVAAVFPDAASDLTGKAEDAKKLLYTKIVENFPDATSSNISTIASYELGKKSVGNADIEAVVMSLKYFLEKWKSLHA